MSQGYKQYFKAARQQKGGGQPVRRPPPTTGKQTPPPKFQKKSGISEDELRAAFNMSPRKASGKKRRLPPLGLTIVLIAIFGLVGFGYSQPKKVEQILNYFEITPMTSANAAEGKAEHVEQKAGTKGENGAKTAETGEKSNGAACPDPSSMSEEDLSHFSRLGERKKQLDLREQELNALEEELHNQRKEVEARIQKLESVRGEISTVLKDRVEVDQQRVNTLVEFYSNMKPKQAADIFANLNEDLAVEVLTKMKKKSAAEIMNLLPADKARTLSEKFTGYKKR